MPTQQCDSYLYPPYGTLQRSLEAARVLSLLQLLCVLGLCGNHGPGQRARTVQQPRSPRQLDALMRRFMHIYGDPYLTAWMYCRLAPDQSWLPVQQLLNYALASLMSGH